MQEELRPEPDEIAEAIAKELRWGPLNCDAGVRANFCCEYCKRDMLASLEAYYSWELDHIVPGGGNDIENIALACRTCNHLKHTYVPLGDSRTEKIESASDHIRSKLERKREELNRLRKILGRGNESTPR